MNLEVHIYQLLQEKEAVELPGFGVFTLQKKTAQLDPESSKLMPPTQEVSFQKQESVNGADLSRYIAAKTLQNLFQVQTEIQEQVALWKQELELSQEITLTGLGNLKVQNEEWILVSPKDLTQTIGFFGLEELHLEPLLNSRAQDFQSDNQYVFGQSILWTFLLILPLGGILFFALSDPQVIFGKKSFHQSPPKSFQKEKFKPAKNSTVKDTLKIIP